MLYEMRVYTLQPGKVAASQELIEKEALEAGVVPVAEGFGGLRRIGLHHAAVAVRQGSIAKKWILRPSPAITASPKSTCACPGSWRNGTNIPRSRWRHSCT